MGIAIVDGRRSLVLITVDCLRADHTGFSGGGQGLTPALDALASESIVFQNAIVAGAPTYYSFPAIMASRNPLQLGRDVVGLVAGEPTITSVLQDAGYSTGAFLAGNPYLSARFGYDAGFDTFQDWLDAELAPLPVNAGNGSGSIFRARVNSNLAKIAHTLGPLGKVYDELYFQYCQSRVSDSEVSFDRLRRFPSADVMVDQALRWLSGVGEKSFFLWLHLMDAHAPYYPSQQALEAIGSGNLTAERARFLNAFWNRSDLGAKGLKRHLHEIKELYSAGIRWADVQVARLVDQLRQSGRWDNSVFALTADHGEEFLDHDGRFHPPSKVTEELIHVPLLIHEPGRTPARIGGPFSHLNLAPTLLEMMGCNVPADFRGRSRWKNIREGKDCDDAAIVECIASCNNPFHVADRFGSRTLAVRESRFKLVLDLGPGEESLFDLQADPREVSPLNAGIEKSTRRRLIERAHQHLAESLQTRNPDHRLRARLRDLRLEWAESTPRIPA